MRFLSFALVLVLLCAPACSTASHKQSVALSRSIYGTERAIAAGRYDLAAKYSAQAVRLTVPPKKKPRVAPIVFHGARYIVLPETQKAENVLSIGSPALTSLLEQSKPLAAQMRAENKALDATETATDKVLMAKESALVAAETAKAIQTHSFWHRAQVLAISAGVLGALGTLCYFFPVVIPALVALFRGAGTIFSLMRGAVGTFFASRRQ